MLVKKIVDLKTENQQNVLNLKKGAIDFDAVKIEKLKIEEHLTAKVLALSNELSKLQSELTAVKEGYFKESSEDKKTISELTHTNKMLEARIRQLQTGISQICHHSFNKNKSQSEVQPDNIYEVERLIDHKKKRDGLHFLVRWKNYSANDDTWERESNIMCGQILNEYKRKMKLN